MTILTRTNVPEKAPIPCVLCGEPAIISWELHGHPVHLCFGCRLWRYDEVTSALRQHSKDKRLRALAQALAEAPAPKYAPKRPGDFRKWRACWGLPGLQNMVRQGKSAEEISEWLAGMHPGLAFGPDTLRRLVAAGQAGELVADT